jgi:hypothetical protein
MSLIGTPLMFMPAELTSRPRPELGFGRGEQRLDIFFAPDVGLAGQRLATARADGGDDLLGLLSVPVVGDRNARAGSAQCERASLADARVAAGDDGAFAREVHSRSNA